MDELPVVCTRTKVKMRGKKLTRLFVILTAKLNFIHLFEEQKFGNYKILCVLRNEFEKTEKM